MNKSQSSTTFKDIIHKPTIKTVILAVLTTIISIFVGKLGTWEGGLAQQWSTLIPLIIIVVLYIVVLCYYATAEVNMRRVIEVQERQIKGFTDLIVNIITVSSTNTSDVNACIHKVNETNTIDPNIWNFEKMCRGLCFLIYKSICDLGGSMQYGVSYVALDERSPKEKPSIKMVAFANKNMHKPSVFGKLRQVVSEEDGKKPYYDALLFCSGKADNVIKWGAEEVNDIFRYPTTEEQEKHRGKYQLYIAVPVFCDNRKMVGLLQIVGMDNSSLGCITRQELEEITDKLLVPYANIFLLFHKMEKALLAGV